MDSRNMKKNQEETNPCLNEHNITMKCFSQNNYNKEACAKEMDNYNLCKQFWGKVRTDRKRKGIRPLLPVVEERSQIKEDYMKTGFK